ncbi:EamA family transporter [Glycomyces xiaoerkulensis]|uniref:EamA family transporter n=1 Tax=Glycomyces xiaoerkulensis TaxID=2038139 RepID=UPI0018E4604C|nr:EamA family transporter [Glycomyces xiaoerkulensis]
MGAELNADSKTRSIAPRTLLGLLLAVAAAIFFGSAGPAAKAVIEAGVTPLQMVWLRLGGAALLLLPYVWITRRRSLIWLFKRNTRYVAAYGIVSFAGVQVCYFVAVSRLPVSIALLLEYLAPALVIAWLVAVRRVRIPVTALTGALTAICGTAVVVEAWTGLRFDLIGVLAGLGAALCQASFFLLSDKADREADPLTMTAGGAVVGAFAVGLLAQPWNLPWGALGDGANIADVSVPVIGLVAWVVVVGTVFAYACGVTAIRMLSAPVAGVIATLEVVVAAISAWLALGERLTAVQILGGVLVLCGALLAQRRRANAAEKEELRRIEAMNAST